MGTNCALSRFRVQIAASDVDTEWLAIWHKTGFKPHYSRGTSDDQLMCVFLDGCISISFNVYMREPQPQSYREQIFQRTGHCPVCDAPAVFSAWDPWFRDHLKCQACASIPRERALMLVLRREVSDWRRVDVHESSPAFRGASLVLQQECAGYTPTQLFPDVPLGQLKDGIRCENLERQTFDSACFDVVITQDVMEHVFDPAAVYREIYRTLRPGGTYLHTVPIVRQYDKTVVRAIQQDGVVHHLLPAEYHGSPSGTESLVTHDYGYDLHQLIGQWSRFDVEIARFFDCTHGILGDFTEVVICRKPAI
jgi:hypothetical protein